MKINRRIKPGVVLAAAALLFLPCMNLMQTHAAKEVDLTQKCSLKISVDIGSADGTNDAWIEDFNRMVIPVSVYKVADVDATGQKYTGVDVFSEMEFESISTDSSTKAAEWQEAAKEAEDILKKALEEKPEMEAAGKVEVKAEPGQTAAGTISDLDTGMYLVVPEASYNPDYTVQYTFSPYLTALPSSEYTLSGAGSDEWVYDTEVGLKPQAVPQYGRLTITKTLENFNLSLGNTTFVFHVTGRDPVTDEVRYDEVVGMTYSAAGNKDIFLDDIPAGLIVTVTEEYSGASYVNSGAASQTAEIWSYAAVEAAEETGASTAAVTFQNRYDGGNRGGYGVTNHFESNETGGWTWESQTVDQPEQ